MKPTDLGTGSREGLGGGGGEMGLEQKKKQVCGGQAPQTRWWTTLRSGREQGCKNCRSRRSSRLWDFPSIKLGGEGAECEQGLEEM